MLDALIAELASIENPRCKWKVEHRLLDILVVAVCAVLGEAEGFEDIALYGRCKREWLEGFLALPNGIPSHDTFRRVLVLVDPDAFERSFLAWVRAVFRPEEGALRQVAIDGKAADSSGRRNTSTGGFAMGTRRRRSDRSGRGVSRSPGRPGVARREDRRRFWTAIAAGRSSEDAAVEVGVSPAVGVRWFREAGGMPPSTLARSSGPPSGRYLSFAEREEVALWRAQGHGVREVARRLGRAASTVSRELRRNAATRGGGLEYRATTAQWHAERAARRPKPAKLATNSALRAYVQDRLAGAVV